MMGPSDDKTRAAFAALDAYTDILAGISPAYGRGHARRLEDLKALMDGKEVE